MPSKRSAPIKVTSTKSKRKRIEPAAAAANNNPSNINSFANEDQAELESRFISLLSQPEHKKGISNSSLKEHFDSDYEKLPGIINALTRSSKLTMSKIGAPGSGASGGTGGEVLFTLISEEEAIKLEGLDTHSKMVYRVIESSGDKGIWTVDVRGQTNIPQGTLTKIFKVISAWLMP